jgi:hypothetical protein
MRRLLATLVLLAACDPASCPAGTTRTSGVCTRVDAGADGSVREDGGADAMALDGAPDGGECACSALPNEDDEAVDGASSGDAGQASTTCTVDTLYEPNKTPAVACDMTRALRPGRFDQHPVRSPS